jgi:tetratricopeptide (TPR) repeat protein
MVYFPEGQDRVLLPYAFDVMSSMDRALSAVVGVPVPGPIRLEIYPSAAALAEVSTLTLEQIETSGTVALCKWNRLMITSPRALVRGYPWVDTIAHELTHLYLSYVTQERAPVWLQEGTAKLLERRWRDPLAPFELDPTSRGLLLRATRDGKLLSFEQLHPSIALLPSQDDATLAFAQVSTFMNAFVESHGERSLREALQQIARGVDAREALARASGMRFSDLERSWRNGLPKAAPTNTPRKLARRFRTNESEAPDESQDVAVSEARRFLRLGDMLWSRRRARAAMFEYEKAHSADTDDPIVAARLARAALEAGDATRSLAALTPLLARYPEHAPTHAVRGAALLELGRPQEARAALLEAIRINPFDPDPHCRLRRVAEDPEDAKVEEAACALLSSPH